MPTPVPPATFSTARLHARPPRAEDAPAVFAAYASDPEVTRYLTWPTYSSPEPLATFLAGCATHWTEADGHYAWLLCLHGTDTPIGSIGVDLDTGKASCGYVFGRAHWGRGYATEALRWLVGWALGEPQIERFWALCAVEHTASARVMEKVSLVREGVLRRWAVLPNLGPSLHDCMVCALVK